MIPSVFSPVFFSNSFGRIDSSFSQTAPQATRNSNGSCSSRSYHPHSIHQTLEPWPLPYWKLPYRSSSFIHSFHIFPIVTWKGMHNSSLVNIPSNILNEGLGPRKFQASLALGACPVRSQCLKLERFERRVLGEEPNDRSWGLYIVHCLVDTVSHLHFVFLTLWPYHINRDPVLTKAHGRALLICFSPCHKMQPTEKRSACPGRKSMIQWSSSWSLTNLQHTAKHVETNHIASKFFPWQNPSPCALWKKNTLSIGIDPPMENHLPNSSKPPLHPTFWS